MKDSHIKSTDHSEEPHTSFKVLLHSPERGSDSETMSNEPTARKAVLVQGNNRVSQSEKKGLN